MNSKTITSFLLFVGCPAAVCAGLFMLSDYSYRPGGVGETNSDLRTVEVRSLDRLKDRFPDINQVADSDFRMFFFYHPHCPCTTAAIRNLSRLSTRFQTRVSIVAFAYCPSDQPGTWIQSSLTDTIRSIPDARVIADPDAATCRAFGAETSGHTMLYDNKGQLQFSGGITPGRGHEGDSRAATALLRRINRQIDGESDWPVFGCPIFLAEDCTE